MQCNTMQTQSLTEIIENTVMIETNETFRVEREREREICLFASNLFNKLPLKTQKKNKKTMILHFKIKQTDNKPYRYIKSKSTIKI